MHLRNIEKREKERGEGEEDVTASFASLVVSRMDLLRANGNLFAELILEQERVPADRSVFRTLRGGVFRD